jgi:hypothetical protein
MAQDVTRHFLWPDQREHFVGFRIGLKKLTIVFLKATRGDFRAKLP